MTHKFNYILQSPIDKKLIIFINSFTVLKMDNNKEEKYVQELYKKFHPNEEIKYYEFYNKFRDEFFDALKNNFGDVIVKYGLDENFLFENKNLLGHLACFCKSSQIEFFKTHFTREVLEHMANYVNCLGKTVFHYSINQIENVEMLEFLFTLTNYINEEDVNGETPFQSACQEYSTKYVKNSDWGKLYMKQIDKIPIDLKPRKKVRQISEMIGVTPFFSNYNYNYNYKK